MKINKIMLFMATIMFVVFTQISVFGADTEPPTELGNVFNQDFMPYLITFLVALGGNSVGNLIVKKIFDGSLKLLGISKDKMELAIKVVGKSNDISEEIKNQISSQLTLAINEINKVKVDIQNLYDKINTELESQTLNSAIIIDILNIVFANDNELVRNGKAEEVKKVIYNGKEKTNNESKV